MWIEQARTVSLSAAATAAGLTVARNTLTPCPMCAAVMRGSSDKRGPIGLSRDGFGWMCHRCGAKGDVVDLVSVKAHGGLFRNINKDDQRKVRAWFANRGACTGIEGHEASDLSRAAPLPKREKQDPSRGEDRPPVQELKGFWASTLSIAQGLDLHPHYSDPLEDWLFRREFSPILCSRLNIARVLPATDSCQWPEWWPKRWADSYRLVVPAYEMDGTFASVHARKVKAKTQGPKTRWPMGHKAGGLVMANGRAVKMMRGDALDFGGDVPGLLVCEGFTDFLRAGLTAMNEGLDLPIIAGTSGCFRQLREMKIPKGLNIFIAMDPDDAGEKYTKIISNQLSDHPIYHLPLKQQET